MTAIKAACRSTIATTAPRRRPFVSAHGPGEESLP